MLKRGITAEKSAEFYQLAKSYRRKQIRKAGIYFPMDNDGYEYACPLCKKEPKNFTGTFFDVVYALELHLWIDHSLNFTFKFLGDHMQQGDLKQQIIARRTADVFADRIE